jgi:hypothetical protein
VKEEYSKMVRKEGTEQYKYDKRHERDFISFAVD